MLSKGKKGAKKRTFIHKVKDAIWRQLADVAGAEVGRLIHVYPEAVEWDLLVEFAHMVEPPLLALRVDEVWEVDWAGPHLGQHGKHIFRI
jgi:hypothetical protein